MVALQEIAHRALEQSEVIRLRSPIRVRRTDRQGSSYVDALRMKTGLSGRQGRPQSIEVRRVSSRIGSKRRQRLSPFPAIPECRTHSMRFLKPLILSESVREGWSVAEPLRREALKRVKQTARRKLRPASLTASRNGNGQGPVGSTPGLKSGQFGERSVCRFFMAVRIGRHGLAPIASGQAARQVCRDRAASPAPFLLPPFSVATLLPPPPAAIEILADFS